ncbi:hypothetical protein OROGR_026223 [Orobanche gracilis]
MEFMREWKSLWPISSTFSAPLLIPNKKQDAPFGPLKFTPSPKCSTTLLESPSLSPRLPPPYPRLSFSLFLQKYKSSPSISSRLGFQLPDYSSYFHGFNSLQLLHIPNKNLIVAFFPTGENSDNVGLSLLSVRDGVLSVHSQTENFFHVVKDGNLTRQRITLLLVNPFDDFCGDENEDGIERKIVTVGFLMVCTHYSVCWYSVGITSFPRQNEYSVSLDYLGCVGVKTLKSNAVVSACWSPHLSEECLVLLDNGELLLFDVNSYWRGNVRSIFPVNGSNRVVNKRMHLSLTFKLGLKEEESGNEGRHWFQCEFSWHPRIFIASHRTEVLLVDLRLPGECNICSLLKLGMLSMGKDDGFFALAMVVSDGFSYTVATKYLLLLCDVRKMLMPVLRWAHGIQNPQYLTVFRLSDLRANAENVEYKLATESGYCIMLGSFWDNEFTYFCYGPDGNGNGNESVSSKISNICNSYYAWGLPSELSLSDSTCKCGSCLVREEFMKMSLPIWIDWRQKQHLILGFGILEADFSSQLSSRNSFGGFILVRLTSSGKIEAQHYLAEWESEKLLGAGHKRKSIYLEDNLLYDCNHTEYDGKKKFQHFKLEFLSSFLKGKLEKHVIKRREKMEDGYEDAAPKRHLVSLKSNFHQEICHKLKAFGPRSSLGVSNVLKDISLPTSIHEIALRSMFAALPTNLMQFAFSTYSDFDEDHETHKEPLEFLNIPDQIQLPPFPFRKPPDRSNKWSSKVQPSNALVGPILPTLFLTTLHKLRMEELKEKRELNLEESEAHTQFKHQCDQVMEVVQEHISSSDAENGGDFISLADDTEHMSNAASQKLKFSCHKPSAFLESLSSGTLWKPGSEGCIFSTHVFRESELLTSDISQEIVGKEIFDVGCPIELKFDDCAIDFGPKELEIFENLKKQDLDFQRRFKPYQDYITRRDGC